MGHVHAAAKTAQLVARYKPLIIFFVGTAGSLDPGSLRFGDVVIPTKVYYRIYEKIVQRGQREFEKAETRADFKEFFFDKDQLLLTDPVTEPITDGARNWLSDISFAGIALRDGTLEPEWLSRLNPQRGPKLEEDATIATCGMLINSEVYRDFLVGLAGRKAYAADMESLGFFKAIADMRQSPAISRTDGIMIRGISDYAGRKESTELSSSNWKEIANHNAAVAAAHAINQVVAKRTS